MADAELRLPTFEERACAFCGQTFRTPVPLARTYCSPICRRKADEVRQHRRKQSTPPKEG